MKPALGIVQNQPLRVRKARKGAAGLRIFLILAGLCVLGVLIWVACTSGGNPDPTTPNTGRLSAIVDISVLVFREGLECILVLTAILASMTNEGPSCRRSVLGGAWVGFGATLITWFIVVGIIRGIAATENVSALNLQAWTGLLAVVVLLVVMNWFFHKVYWGGWISLHNRKKRELLENAQDPAASRKRLMFGLGLLGFSSFYREGFEVVLFLQTYLLKLGGATVLGGTLLGLFLTGIVAVLNFIAHRRLPYRKMLVLTGLMLGGVLLIMVGEQAQEMQQAGWIHTTTIAWLEPYVPDWAGLWFSIFPTVESLIAQAVAAVLVVGSYFLARRLSQAEET
jgi:high-affinity iron transporter